MYSSKNTNKYNCKCIYIIYIYIYNFILYQIVNVYFSGIYINANFVVLLLYH